jgi:hypothetical protein
LALEDDPGRQKPEEREKGRREQRVSVEQSKCNEFAEREIFLSNFQSKIPYVVWSDKETADSIPADFRPILREMNDRIRWASNFSCEREERILTKREKKILRIFLFFFGSEKEQKMATN